MEGLLVLLIISFFFLRIFVDWRDFFPQKLTAKPDQTELGLEEIKFDRLNELNERNQRLADKTGADRRNISGIESADLRIPKPHAPQTTTSPISDKDCATRLVHGIALHNDIVLFTKTGLAEDKEAPSRLIHDILTALCPQIKVVDVSSDRDMHLGLPHADGNPILPCLYVGGDFIGDQNAVLRALDSGELVAQLEQAKIEFNKETAQALMQTKL